MNGTVLKFKGSCAFLIPGLAGIQVTCAALATQPAFQNHLIALTITGAASGVLLASMSGLNSWLSTTFSDSLPTTNVATDKGEPKPSAPN